MRSSSGASHDDHDARHDRAARSFSFLSMLRRCGLVPTLAAGPVARAAFTQRDTAMKIDPKYPHTPPKANQVDPERAAGLQKAHQKLAAASVANFGLGSPNPPKPVGQNR